jgi:hypothetical protein
MKKFFLIPVLLLAGLLQAQTTTYTGTIKDLALNPVTAGQVQFTLTPPADSTLPGTGRFTPIAVTCNINADGTLSGFVGGVVSGACKVTSNTALSPSGTAYRICIQPYNQTPGSCFFDYAITSTKDITTIAPTLQTGPLNYNGVPGPALNFLGAWSGTTVYQTGQAVSYNNQVYISILGSNLNQTPTSSPSFWSIVVSPASLIAAPNVTQTVTQPTGTTFQANSLNGEVNASLFAGSELGAKIRAAILALPGRCGTVLVPAGTYTQTTTVTKPACVNIKGQSSASTIINWTPTSGVAFVLADTAAETYPEGAISDLRLVGPGVSTSTIGVYFGGDPAGVISPSGSSGDTQNLNRVIIWSFGTGLKWGNNAWNNGFVEDEITNNGTGIFYPGDIINSGEAISFFSSGIQNNIQGFNILGYSDFYFYGSHCDYNATCGTVGGAATVHLYGMHFEQGNGTILTIGVSPDPRPNVFIDGGQIVISKPTCPGIPGCFTGTDSQVINVPSGSPGNLTIRNALVFIVHPYTNFVAWSTTNPNGILHLEDLIYTNPENFTNNTSNCAFTKCSIKHAKYTIIASATAIAANTCSVQDMRVPGIRPGDLIASVTKLTPQAGLAVIGAQTYTALVSPGDHVSVQFCNVTAAAIVPTAGDTYTFLVEQ